NCGTGAFLNSKNSRWQGQDNPFASLPKFADLMRVKAGYQTYKSRKTFAFNNSRQNDAMKRLGKIGYERYGLYVGSATSKQERRQRHEEVVKNSRREMQWVLKANEPWFFVFGSINVHRPYVADSGMDLWDINPDSLKGLIPPHLPDVHDVRRDFSDYLGEVMALDLMLGAMLDELEKAGQLDNTLVILSGDHGIPGVPRGKTNCYDLATRVSLMARLPRTIPAERKVDDFISVMDVGPTLLDFAGVTGLESFDGRSFLSQLKSDRSGWIDPSRDSVFIGRERHYHTARDGNIPYPMRAIRTKDHLYIRNFKPDRWPMGNPYDAADIDERDQLYAMGLQTAPAYKDLDGSLTKAFMLSRRDAEDDDSQKWLLTMHHRPSEELYDLRNDSHQLQNLADASEYAQTLLTLRERVDTVMKESNDPRLNDRFDYLPWSDPGLKR
ncbi:MAG: sulfatase-like hydrolase/transferase, partial [Planctomycetota bacterium]